MLLVEKLGGSVTLADEDEKERGLICLGLSLDAARLREREGRGRI